MTASRSPSVEPILLVDGNTVLAGAALSGASVAARVVGAAKAPKIDGSTYEQAL